VRTVCSQSALAGCRSPDVTFLPRRGQKERRDGYADLNLKANEFLYRRVDVADVVEAHLLAIERAPSLGFRKFIISATSLFSRADLAELHRHAPAVVRRYAPDYVAEYARCGWKMLPSIDRVYVNERARMELGWRPKYQSGHRAGHRIAVDPARLPGASGAGAGRSASPPDNCRITPFGRPTALPRSWGR
jgi:UDP-glucose 4-epimerase